MCELPWETISSTPNPQKFSKNFQITFLEQFYDSKIKSQKKLKPPTSFLNKKKHIKFNQAFLCDTKNQKKQVTKANKTTFLNSRVHIDDRQGNNMRLII